MPHDAYFQGNPTRLDISRSKMHAAPRWSGTWNTGRLVPIFATSSIMPGDTFKMSVASAIRMTRPVVPVMDDMDITVEAFFVPHRLVLSRRTMSPTLNDGSSSWTAFIGAQDSLLNMPTPGDIKLPTQVVAYNSYLVGGMADCLGYHRPMGGSNSSYQINPLKTLAFYSVWNEYWREPNTQSPVTYSISADASSVTGNYLSFTGADAGISIGLGAGIGQVPLPPVSRYHGYFGSALPWPQRNSTNVTMPLGDLAPVVARDNDFHLFNGVPTFRNVSLWKGLSGSSTNPITSDSTLLAGYDQADAGGNLTPELFKATSSTRNNMFADLSSATAASVNQFRLAVQTQRWYEALARSGNKYSDLVDGMFGVRGPSIPDRPEYLGGFTAPINISQVNGTSGTDLGATGAFSLSNPGGYLFTKSFTEHGTLIVVACCRVRESFSQGVKKEDQRFERFDFFWPQFANIGEEPLYKKFLYVDGTAGNTNDDAVFGYQEAWAEYRTFTDDVTGYLNPGVSGGIGQYTYANYFNGHPSLKGYLDASPQVSNVDRTLSASAATVGYQFFGQFQFDIEMVRPMPTYSIPGLVDHH